MNINSWLRNYTAYNDGYFKANALLGQWNSIKTNSIKKMAHFIENTNTNEFIKEIHSRNSDHADIQPLRTLFW